MKWVRKIYPDFAVYSYSSIGNPNDEVSSESSQSSEGGNSDFSQSLESVAGSFGADVTNEHASSGERRLGVASEWSQPGRVVHHAGEIR